MNFFESNKRSVAKAISWRFLATVFTFGYSYYLTRSFGLSVRLTVAVTLFGLLTYYIHERIWNAISWGREDREE
ncbi:MAG: hypothetical protein COU90_03670 [Candidatus Ryanbacteria bacterium CG10_big_fil_rev_8_21_14_0_10_43_42]|uniref:DUF2061 domain-containing protein n=1 Tax=Candidatus Ryanbacteria bacterium CG10_big_fil_rev_8_21_14_0_10_43_42 TaxID=1974864 RepID=A0A2M8KW66_9BACT|nr:MAG: hypothetical protein COU90_03670 [Candidatus Ryanbacteria bacterium CG10_big_fil_rev_8_21_14_0_10_43_42]